MHESTEKEEINDKRNEFNLYDLNARKEETQSK